MAREDELECILTPGQQRRISKIFCPENKTYCHDSREYYSGFKLGINILENVCAKPEDYKACLIPKAVGYWTYPLEKIPPYFLQSLSRIIQGIIISINFPNLKELTCEAAKELAKHKGGIDLSSLDTLSCETARELGKHSGILDLSG